MTPSSVKVPDVRSGEKVARGLPFPAHGDGSREAGKQRNKERPGRPNGVAMLQASGIRLQGCLSAFDLRPSTVPPKLTGILVILLQGLIYGQRGGFRGVQ